MLPHIPFQQLGRAGQRKMCAARERRSRRGHHTWVAQCGRTSRCRIWKVTSDRRAQRIGRRRLLIAGECRRLLRYSRYG